MSHTDAELGNQRVGDDAVVVDTCRIGLLNAGALKRTLRRTAGGSENRGLEHDGPGVAEASGQAILVGHVVVHLVVERGGVLVIGQQREVVVGFGIGGTDIGVGNQAENFGGDCVDAVGGNDVARKRSAARTVGIAGSGVVDGGSGPAQIAAANTGRRDVEQIGVGLVIGLAQDVAKEEELVLLDGSAKVAAEVVVGHVADRGDEEIAGVEFAVAQEFVSGAVEIVRSRLQLHVRYRTGSAAEFGVEVGGGNAHGLNRFDWRHQNL